MTQPLPETTPGELPTSTGRLVTTGPPTAAVTADARNRALRTAAQGLVIDVTAAVVLAIAPVIFGADFAWTAGYWATIGLLAAKTIIQTGLSYLMRRLIPPAPSP